jgi:hypothetical protein
VKKKAISIKVVEEGENRFLVRTFADGEKTREPIVKLPRKPPRWPYRKVSFDKSNRKGF